MSIRSKLKLNTWWKRLIFDLMLIALVVWGIGKWQTRYLLPTNTGQIAPAFTLLGIDGKTYQLDTFQGKKILLYFFAPWCSVCDFTSANVAAIEEELGSDLHVLAIGLSYDTDKEVREFALEHSLDNIPVLIGNDDVQKAYHIRAFPTFYFLDEEGKIADHAVGYTTKLGLKWRK